MLAIKETLKKISTLDDDGITIVISLVDFLSDRQTRNSEENPFRKIRENRKGDWLSEDEIDEIVSDVRKQA